MLATIATAVITLGRGRVKPCVYLRPSAQTTSSRPATTRMSQTMADGIVGVAMNPIVLQQPVTSPGEPRKLPAEACVIELRTPLLRAEAIRDVQARYAWSDELLDRLLIGLAFVRKADGGVVYAQGTDIVDHPASAANQTDFVSGPVMIGAWVGAGAMTVSRLFVPERALRRVAIPEEEREEGDDAEDVFEALWRQARTHGWTAAGEFMPLGMVRLATDTVLFRRAFIARTFGVRAILHSVGLGPTPREPSMAEPFLDWAEELTAVRTLVGKTTAASDEQRAAVAAAIAITD